MERFFKIMVAFLVIFNLGVLALWFSPQNPAIPIRGYVRLQDMPLSQQQVLFDFYDIQKDSFGWPTNLFIKQLWQADNLSVTDKFQESLRLIKKTQFRTPEQVIEYSINKASVIYMGKPLANIDTVQMDLLLSKMTR